MPRILYIEDNEPSRDFLSRRLWLEGFQVTQAEDGRAGLAAAVADLPDLILMDMSLPGMSGWEAIREFKSNGATATIPVVALSAHAMAEDHAKARAAGFDDFDTKPVRIERLLGIINKHLARPPATVAAPDERPAPTPAPPVPSGGRGRVLVVDDQDHNLDLLTRRLELAGYQAIGASSGREALNYLDGHEVDCVLLDVNMPGINGLEVLAILRTSHSAADLPVIMVTARGGSSDVVNALDAGANDYITKPIDIAVLLARLALQVELLTLRRSLRGEKELRDGLVDSAQEIILCVDARGIVSEYNSFAESSLGYPRGEVLGRPALMLFGDRERAAALLDEVSRGAPMSGETFLSTRRGNLLPVRYSCAPLRMASGGSNGVVMLAVDISRENELETERRRLDRMRESFMTIATHDMKSPLSSIMGFSSLLEDSFRAGDVLTEEGAEFIRRIARTSRVLKALVEDFLDFRALNASQIVLKRSAVDLNLIAGDCCEMVDALAAQRGIRLELDLEGSPAIVDADARRIRQVISNFVENALKFTPTGGLVIVRTRRIDGDIRVQVEDTGPGVPESDIEIIFKPWAVSAARAHGNEKSTGLGLSICAEFIRLHGGGFGVENKPTGGSIFHFSLPVAGQVPDIVAPLGWSSEVPMAAPAGLPRGQVLVVEDEPSSALLAKVVLERAGYAVVLADSIETALDAARANPLDAAMLDLSLGAESGLTLIERLRAMPACASLPIALVTGESRQQAQAAVARVGVRYIVEKPFDPQGLVAALESILTP